MLKRKNDERDLTSIADDAADGTGTNKRDKRDNVAEAAPDDIDVPAASVTLGDPLNAAATELLVNETTAATEATAATTTSNNTITTVTSATISLTDVSPRTGKPTHPVWELFTHKFEPYKLANGDTAECAHCNQIVRHHNKVLSAVRHLRKCRVFVTLLNQMSDAEQPEWFHAGTKRGKPVRHRVSLDSVPSIIDRKDVSIGTDSTIKSVVIESSPATQAPVVTTSAVALAPVVETSAFTSADDDTGVAVDDSAIGQSAVVVAIKNSPSPTHLLTTSPAAIVPSTSITKSSKNSSKNSSSIRPIPATITHRPVAITTTPTTPVVRHTAAHSSTLIAPAPPRLSYSVPAAAASTTTELATPTTYTCVLAVSAPPPSPPQQSTALPPPPTTDSSLPVAAIEYFASSLPVAAAAASASSTRSATSAVQRIDAVAIDSDKAIDAAWLAQDVVRVLQSLDVRSLCGVVTSSNTVAIQHARALLSDRHFPSRFFHGCAIDALDALVVSLFSDRTSDAADLAAFTIDCERVAAFVTALDSDDRALCDAFIATQHSVLATNSNSSRPCHVLSARFQALRSHVGAIQEMLESARNNGRDRGSLEEDDATAAACDAIVHAPHFVASLDCAIAILAPIVAATLTFSSHTRSNRNRNSVMLSDVFQTFVVVLPTAFRALGSVTETTQALVRACETSFNAMAGAAHGLANLLDPRFLGDGMSRELQERVEDALFSFPADDRSASNANDTDAANELRQETIYTQYTEFRVASLQERSKKSFRYQMLCKGRKSALQYWQSDGTFWPELQQVALKVFSMAATTTAAIGSTVSAVDSV